MYFKNHPRSLFRTIDLSNNVTKSPIYLVSESLYVRRFAIDVTFCRCMYCTIHEKEKAFPASGGGGGGGRGRAQSK
jgi:hypothetical protein